MLTWARRLARAVNSLVAAVAWLLALVVVVVVFVCWHTVHAPDLRVMRQILAATHALVSKQAIEAISLRARVEAERGEIVSLATIQFRRRAHVPEVPLYFLLDPGLRVEQITRETGDGTLVPVSWARIGPLVRIAPVSADVEAPSVTVRYAGRPVLHPADCRINHAEVVLAPDCLWYPLDGQSFFTVDANVQLPANWELVDSAPATEVYWRGRYREYHWEAPRPLAGFGLVAGSYRFQERWVGEVRLRTYVQDRDELDPARLLDTMENAYVALARRFGPSGFPVLSLFVHPELGRAFHDGAGTMGLPRRSLASEDAGFGLVAHELAHSWWGATVTGGWLRSGTGAQWIIEGFAEFSSLLATEAVYGRDAVLKRLLGEFYDPQEQQPLIDMTVLDNALPQARARETIYRKGAYTLWMLRRIVGEGAFFSALTELVRSSPHKEVGVAEVQEALERASGQTLGDFFDAFVRGRDTVDFSLDPSSPGTLSLTNVGTAKWRWPVTVVIREADTTESRHLEVVPPAEIPLGSASAEVLVDPELQWADMTRHNNRYPRKDEPLFVAPSDRGRLVVFGEPFPWSKTRARFEPTVGDRKEWEFPRGLLEPPLADSDHGWFVLNVAAPRSDRGTIVALETNGVRRDVGVGRAPVPAEDGAILAAVGNRLVRYGPSGRTQTLLQLPNEHTVEMVVPLSSREHFALVASGELSSRLLLQRGVQMPVETVLEWERSLPFVVWRATDDSFFVGLPDGGSWEVWQLSPDASPARPLVEGAVLLSDLTLSPDGNLLAFLAAPARQYPRSLRQVFVLDLTERRVRTWSDPELDFTQIAWDGNDRLLGVARRIPRDQPLFYPWSRQLVRIQTDQDAIAVEPTR